MGMYDCVRSEIPLPDGFTGELQTKDLERILAKILIRADGRLMIEERDYEHIPLSERPFPDDPDPLNRLIGSIKSTHRRWRDLDYHGDLRFYGNETTQSGELSVWHQYVARFTYGTLEYIKNEDEDA